MECPSSERYERNHVLPLKEVKSAAPHALAVGAGMMVVVVRWRGVGWFVGGQARKGGGLRSPRSAPMVVAAAAAAARGPVCPHRPPRAHPHLTPPPPPRTGPVASVVPLSEHNLSQCQVPSECRWSYSASDQHLGSLPTTVQAYSFSRITHACPPVLVEEPVHCKHL